MIFLASICLGLRRGAGAVSMRHAFRGPNTSCSTACASGAHAVGEALQLLRARRCTTVVAGVPANDGRVAATLYVAYFFRGRRLQRTSGTITSASVAAPRLTLHRMRTACTVPPLLSLSTGAHAWPVISSLLFGPSLYHATCQGDVHAERHACRATCMHSDMHAEGHACMQVPRRRAWTQCP